MIQKLIFFKSMLTLIKHIYNALKLFTCDLTLLSWYILFDRWQAFLKQVTYFIVCLNS